MIVWPAGCPSFIPILYPSGEYFPSRNPFPILTRSHRPVISLAWASKMDAKMPFRDNQQVTGRGQVRVIAGIGVIILKNDFVRSGIAEDTEERVHAG